MTIATDIQSLYIAYFNRPADYLGLKYWTAQAQANGGSVAAVANAFSASPEYTAQFAGQSSAQIINTIYMNLFGRPAEPDAITYWGTRLDNKTFNIGTIATSILVGAQNLDKTTISNKVAAAEAFYAAMDTSVEIIGYDGAAANNVVKTWLSTVTSDAASLTAATTPAALNTVLANAAAAHDNTSGTTFALTSAVDNLTGTAGNDTFVADNTGATAQSGAADVINGGSGNDTLKVFLAAGATTFTAPALSSVETVHLNGGVATAYTSPGNLIVEAPVLTGGAVATATYTVGSGSTVTLKDANVTANSTTTVAAGGATANVTLNGWTSTGAAIANTLDLSTAANTALNLTAAGSSKVTLTNTGGAITTLNILGSAAANVTLPAAITTINAAAATGNVTITEGGLVAAGFKFTGGSGNDTITLVDNQFGTLTAGTQLNGGTGTDKLVIADTALTAAEAAKLNAVAGFESLGLTGVITLDAATVSTFKAFSVDAGVAATINNLATGSTTTIANGGATVTLGTSVGVLDHTITLSGVNVVAGVNVAGITNLTVNSNGTSANTITLANSDNSSVTLKGASDITLALAAGTAVASKIDASALTGKATLTGSSIVGSGDIIIGGSAADTINGGSGADTLTGGAGADTFVFGAAAAANASGAAFGQADVITDFVVGTDKLQFAGVVDIVSGQQVAVQTAVTALVAGSTDAQIAEAMATANTTNLGVSVATFGGNTYVLYETVGASTGVAIDDVFVKLTGVTTGVTFASSIVA
jgi:Ca2+-binding RTX toxin-like protein